jgi:hypothetical protein
MTTKKSAEEKIPIRSFKDGSSNWFVRDAHYFLNEDNEIMWAAGETDKKELREAILAFIGRNKKTYVPRETSIFEREEIEYTKIGFGKYSQMTTVELVSTDKSYANWLYTNPPNKKIKEELKTLLKK